MFFNCTETAGELATTIRRWSMPIKCTCTRISGNIYTSVNDSKYLYEIRSNAIGKTLFRTVAEHCFPQAYGMRFYSKHSRSVFYPRRFHVTSCPDSLDSLNFIVTRYTAVHFHYHFAVIHVDIILLGNIMSWEMWIYFIHVVYIKQANYLFRRQYYWFWLNLIVICLRCLKLYSLYSYYVHIILYC
jgi:hypothetical protein